MYFYKETLDGQLEILSFEGNPVDVPEDCKDKVVHATFWNSMFGYFTDK